MQLLQVSLGILLQVFRETVLDGLLQLLLDVSTNVAYLNLGLLGNLVALLNEVTTALLSRLGQTQTDNLAIILWSDAHVRVHDGLLDVADLLLVPRLDGNGTGIGSGDVGNLVQRNSGTVRFYTYAIENGYVSTASTYTAQLLFQEHRSHLHALFRVG